MPDRKPKALIIGDSPTVFTGFGEVVRSLAQRWLPHFESISIWGINYNGWPHEYPYKIYPAGFSDWTSNPKLVQLLNLIGAGDFTHLFILADSHMLATVNNFPQLLREICTKKKVHITHYYPVDSQLEPAWLDLLALVDAPVTYTKYGYDETVKARPTLKPAILPHGVDMGIYYPREDRETLRERIFKGWVKPDEFLLVNVNRNERRKAPQHSLQLIKRLREIGVNAKLLMHCPNVSPSLDSYNLELIAKQLDVPSDCWQHNDSSFVNGNGLMDRDGMNQLYNCADMVVSTSLGEGFGLSFVEGAAAGCMVALPDHTSCAEIADGMVERKQEGQFYKLPLQSTCAVNAWDSSRVRYAIDVNASAEVIKTALANHDSSDRFILNPEVREWLSWDRIAAEFLKLMKEPSRAPIKPSNNTVLVGGIELIMQ